MTGRTVILAAGDFPAVGSEGERLLRSAQRVIACDSAAEAYRARFGHWPEVVIGDLDSVTLRKVPRGSLVRRRDQTTNDLTKALEFCRAKGWGEIVVVGASGRREDHTIGNVYRALDAGVRVVTDFGEFLPVRGSLSFRTWKGAGISVFAPDSKTKMSSKGLRWKLQGVRFENAYCATLNRASAESVTLTADRPAFVYVERDPESVRAVVSLGSNLGNRAANLRRALAALSKLPRTRLLEASAVRETEPVDVPSEFASRRFLNQAAVFETALSPLVFSRAMHAIEDRLGRVRTVRNGPRTIDLDLILLGGVRLKTRELTLPHPRAAERSFVLEPLEELGITIGECK